MILFYRGFARRDTRKILPRCLVSLCMALYREKQQQQQQQQQTLELLIYFEERFKISTKYVCANIFVTLLRFGIVLWTK